MMLPPHYLSAEVLANKHIEAKNGTGHTQTKNLLGITQKSRPENKPGEPETRTTSRHHASPCSYTHIPLCFL